MLFQNGGQRWKKRDGGYMMNRCTGRGGGPNTRQALMTRLPEICAARKSNVSKTRSRSYK